MVGTIRDSSERRGTIGAWRSIEVLEGDFLQSREEVDFSIL